jgi:hypothetical protein
MKLHGLARVKNEGDVIEEFVRHNLRFLDGLTVIDNASFDGTLDVLEALRAEGLPLTILHDGMLQKRQYETMTWAAQRSAALDAWDYLFLLDADEFIKAGDRAQLVDALAALPPGWNGFLRWFTYVPSPKDDAAEPRVLSRIRHRRIAEPEFFKSVVSRACAAAGAFSIGQGNHTVYGAHGEAPRAALDGIGLAHFPVRSVAQLQGKALVGWTAYLAMGEDRIGPYGWHQRRLFESLESGGAWTDRQLFEFAATYTDGPAPAQAAALTYDPMPATPDRRYGDAAVTDAVQFSARYLRQLARVIADAGVAFTPPTERPPTDG